MTADQEKFALPDFQLLFEGCHHPYLVLTPTPAFTILAVNNRYLAATGTSRPEIVGRGLFEVFPDNGEDPAATGVGDLRSSLNRALRDRTQDVMGVQKYDIPRPSPEEGFEVKYWSPVNTPIFAPDGEIAYLIHHVEDITEFILSQQRSSRETSRTMEKVQKRSDIMEAEVLRRANEVRDSNRQLKVTLEELELSKAELTRLNERLQELDRAKTVFFGNVSHEFRTPLALMLGPLEDLMSRADQRLSATDRSNLGVAHRNALRLLKLVNALLEISSIEAGTVQANRRQTDLAATTVELASGFRSAIEKAGLAFEVHCPPLPAPVCVDPDMWEKIVLNLLSNALKFTRQGRITVRQQAVGDRLELSVTDTGCGIAAAEQELVFERFHRVQGSDGRSFEGTGIGLALVADLARLHGGTVRLASTPGQGSSFTVAIPFAPPLPDEEGAAGEKARSLAVDAGSYREEALRWLPEEPIPTPSAEGPDGGESAGMSRSRILLADDNADMRAYVGRLLGERYRVQAVADGEAAWSAVLESPPDLVLTDVMMPRLDGFGLLSRLRLHRDTRTIPVLMLSARAAEESRIGGLQAGADDYLVKPFAARELLARVQALLDLTRLRREAARTEERLAAQERSKAELKRMVEVRTRELAQRNEELKKAQRLLELETAERLQAQAALREREQLLILQSRMAAMGEMLGNIAHQWRQPLNVLALKIQEIALLNELGTLEQVTLQAGIGKSMEIIQHLSQTIEDCRSLANPDREKRRFSVQEALAKAVSLVKESFQAQGIDITTGVSGTPSINGHRNEFCQALLNILINARDAHREQGTPDAFVAVRAWEEEGAALLTITDNAGGIAEEIVDRIFDPYFTTKGLGKGSGVGLFMSKTIVERNLGGRLTVRNTGSGAEFSIRVAPDAADPVA